MTLCEWAGVEPKDFDLFPRFFDMQSASNGAGQTYRVMLLSLLLGEALRLKRNGRLAFFGALIHDMARISDARSPGHGPMSAETKLPLFIPLFKKYGVSAIDLDEISEAVWFHSKKKKTRGEDAGKHTMNILKDADMLDRVRSNDVDKDLLRYPESIRLIPIAELLYKKTRPFSAYRSFADFCAVADSIITQTQQL